MIETLLAMLLVLAPVPKETRADDDVWAWYRNPKFDEKWMGDAEFRRLFQRGVDAGFFCPVGGLYLYATDAPSLRFRKWWLESYSTMPGGGPAKLMPFATPPLIWPGGVTKDEYKSWDK